jgi:hypothetical protein
MLKIAILSLLSVPAFGQLATDLPMPAPPSASSSINHKAWAAFGIYWYADAMANRAKVQFFENQKPVVDLTELKSLLGDINARTIELLQPVQPATNVKVAVIDGKVTISFDYDAPTTNIEHFALMRSEGNGDGWHHIASTIGWAQRDVVDMEPIPGVVMYAIVAQSRSYTTAKDSIISNAVTYTQ